MCSILFMSETLTNTSQKLIQIDKVKVCKGISWLQFDFLYCTLRVKNEENN